MVLLTQGSFRRYRRWVWYGTNAYEYASGGYVNKPMEYAYGGYVNKPRAMGHGGYVQGQGSSMDMAEKENVRPVNRTLSTALSPTLSIKLLGNLK